MNLKTKLMVGATALFVLIVAAGIYISQQSEEFKSYHEPFVRNFMSELTVTWELADVKHHLSEKFLEQADTEEGRAYLNQFSSLGPVRRIQEIEMGKYFSGSEGTLGEFIFQAEFDRRKVLVRLTLHEQSGEVKVQGLTINNLDDEGQHSEFLADN